MKWDLLNTISKIFKIWPIKDLTDKEFEEFEKLKKTIYIINTDVLSNGTRIIKTPKNNSTTIIKGEIK